MTSYRFLVPVVDNKSPAENIHLANIKDTAVRQIVHELLVTDNYEKLVENKLLVSKPVPYSMTLKLENEAQFTDTIKFLLPPSIVELNKTFLEDIKKVVPNDDQSYASIKIVGHVNEAGCADCLFVKVYRHTYYIASDSFTMECTRTKARIHTS